MRIKRKLVLATVLVFFLPICVLGDEDRSTAALLKQMYFESVLSLAAIEETQEKIEEKISGYERLGWQFSKNRFSHNTVDVLNALLFLKTQREKMKTLKVGAEYYYYLAYISSSFCQSQDCGFSQEETALVLKDLNDLRIVRHEIARIGTLMAVN